MLSSTAHQQDWFCGRAEAMCTEGFMLASPIKPSHVAEVRLSLSSDFKELLPIRVATAEIDKPMA